MSIVRFLLVSLMLLHFWIACASGQQTSTWLENIEHASSLYDQRGYMKDKARTVDGNVSVSRSTGNVQYVFDISSYSVNSYPVNVSLSYNQNASFTAYQRYDYQSDSWISLKQNRPVWILGVNGFAVQALHSVTRNVLQPWLRQDVKNINKPFDSQFGEDDLNWLLDGYDACNSMRSTERGSELSSNETCEHLDEIKLLRADGSTLSLVRMEKRVETAPGVTPTGQNLVSGTYVTADANSTAFAIVELNPSRMSAKYKTAVYRQLEVHSYYWYRNSTYKDIPAEYIPRTVYYYPGDGSCYVFDEYKTPFGMEPMFGQDAVGGNTDTYSADDVTFSGYGASAPSIFYLRSITYNTLPVTSFSYSAHHDIECGDDNLARGRGRLTGFDNHTISYTGRGLEINALGRLFVIECDAGLLSGMRDNDSKSSYYEGVPAYRPDNTAPWDDPYQYQSWTPLVTRVVDPGPREYRLTYEPYTRVQKASPFPFTTLKGETECCPEVLNDCQCGGHGSSNHSDLLTQVARLTLVEDPYATYSIGYFNVSEPDDAVFKVHLRERYGAAIPEADSNWHVSYIPEFSAVPAPGNSPIVDPIGSTVANALTKKDRAFTSALGPNAGSVLWMETYHRDYNYTALNAPDDVPREAETTVNRATYSPNGAIVHTTTTEKVARFKMPIGDQSYFNMTDGAFDRHIYHTDVVQRATRVGDRSEVEKTVYDHVRTPWERNWHLPDHTLSESWIHSGQGEPQVLPKARTDYSYQFDPAPDYIAYGMRDGDIVSRGALLINSYGVLLKQKTATLSQPSGDGGYSGLSKTIEDYHYYPVIPTHSLPTVEIIDKLKSLENLRRLYPVDEWEYRWNNAQATDPWVVIRDKSQMNWEVESVRYHLPPYSRLLTSTETQDGKNAWRTEQRTLHVYNSSVPTQEKGGLAAYGRRVSTTTSGRGDERSRMERIEYGLYSGASTQRALPSAMFDPFGAQQVLAYAGGPFASSSLLSVALGKQSGIRQITNLDCSPMGLLAPEKDRRVSLALDNRFALLYEQPIHSMSVVRRPTRPSPLNASADGVMRIETSQAYTHYGLTSATVDANGFLSQFSYDDIGRLKTAWLPLDFPSDPEQISIDRIVSKLNVEGWGFTSEKALTKQVLRCFVDCDAPVPMVLQAVDEPAEQLPQYSVGVFRLPPGQCPCSGDGGIRVKSEGAETVQHTTPPEAELVTSKYLVRHTTMVEFIVPRSRVKELTNGKISLSVGAMPEYVLAYPVVLTLYAGDNVIHQQDDTNPLLIGQVLDPNQQPAYSPVATYDGRVSLDLMAIPGFSSLATGSVGDEDVRLRLEIKPLGDTYGRVDFGDIRLELEGVITEPDVNAQNDWTIHIEHADAPAHRVLTKVKIDDRPTAYDYVSYPVISTMPNLSVYTRHTKQLTELTTDDLVKRTLRGFEPSAQGFLDPTSTLTAASETNVIYTGAGQVSTSVNERQLSTTRLYDGWGMQTGSETGPFVRDWPDIGAASAQPIISGAARERQMLDVRTPADFFFPTSFAQHFNGYCARALQVVSSSTENSKRLNATFTDGLGRTIVAVQAYDSVNLAEDLTQADPTRSRNACTWYTYDSFGRTLTVTNPIGQMISYSYDDFGNVKTTSHPDNGTTSYAYDVAGRLRFSQTQAQSDAAKLTFRQYDDLGRTTIIGEAAFHTQNPGNNLVLNQRLTDVLNPDVLHTAVSNPVPTVNNTLFMAPVATPPALYQMGMQPQGLPPNGNNLVQMAAICPPLANAMNSHTFNPAFPGLPQNVIQHAVRFHPYPTVKAPIGEFEEIHRYPSFVLQSSWYDDLPPSVGAVWAGFPTAGVWNALAPRDTVRNLRGRMAAVAYRTHGGQPFHYIVLSYDERGRVEAQLRLTENIGFDAVYYRYNALNKITSVHVVDATGQHATFYGYDSEGRVSKMWAERSNGIAYGLGTSMTPQRPTLIEPNRQALPHAVYGYDAADAVTSVDYPRLGVTTTIDVNARGAQLRTRTQTSDLLARTIFEQRLGYDDLDQITNAWSSANGMADFTDYHYDALGRLHSALGRDATLTNFRSEGFGYDLVGNRRNAYNDGLPVSYTHAPTTNRLTGFVQGDVATPGYRSHTLGYHSDGALATRERTDVQGGRTVARSESFAYDAFGLIERYRVQRDVGGLQGSCTPDAALQPISEWRYRFGPLQEREQKRQYLSDIPADGLAWTYTLLGADAKQLASYNGIQGAFCNQPPTTAWLWPVEYNSYGPAHTRLIMRPTGAVEYVVHDHLGSARITLDNAARVIESRSYTAFGDELTSSGTGARTSYIGRETDNESDLGFYGVRLYDPTYGRFLSTDPLWGKYLPLQSYQYAGNSPVMMLDDGGKEIVAARDVDREYLRTSMCTHFGVDVSFTDQGAMRISSDQLAQAQANNDPLSYGQLLNITEMANDNSKTLNVFALPGEEYRKDRMTLSSDMVPPPSSVFPTGPRASEVFISHADAPTNSAILIRPEIAGKETFAAVGGGETKPCGTCVLVHALLDHAMPWFKLGVSATRKEGVQNHNVGLTAKAQSVVRDGSDHDDEGKPKQ